MALAAHGIDPEMVAHTTEVSRDFVEDARQDLDEIDEIAFLLPRLFDYGVRLGAGLHALGQDPAPELRRAARAMALLFVHAEHGHPCTTIPFDDAGDVVLDDETLDRSPLNAVRWVDAMWCALAVGDELARQWLASVPVTGLAPEGVTTARYHTSLGELLRSVVLRDGRHAEWLKRTLDDLDDDDDPMLDDPDPRVEGIDEPSLRALFAVLTDDGVDEAMTRLHEAHRAYWTSSDNARAVEGLLSLPGCAIRRLAHQLDVTVTVDSGYVPAEVWQPAEVIHELRCPYCVGPLADPVARCPLCGSLVKDAPIVATAEVLAQEPRTPCVNCAHPLHPLAVRCPQCGTATDGEATSA